jgi:hypothetical protein
VRSAGRRLRSLFAQWFSAAVVCCSCCCCVCLLISHRLTCDVVVLANVNVCRLRIEWNQLSERCLPAYFAAQFQQQQPQQQRPSPSPSRLPSPPSALPLLMCDGAGAQVGNSTVKSCAMNRCGKFAGEQLRRVVVHLFCARFQFSPYQSTKLWEQLTTAKKHPVLAADLPSRLADAPLDCEQKQGKESRESKDSDPIEHLASHLESALDLR